MNCILFSLDSLVGGLIALAGVLVASLISYKIAKQTQKLELVKLGMSYYVEKMKKLESIRANYNIDYASNINGDEIHQIVADYNFLSKQFKYFEYYFSKSKHYEIVKNKYDCIVDSMNDENSPSDLCYHLYKEFNCLVDDLINTELHTTNDKIMKIRY